VQADVEVGQWGGGGIVCNIGDGHGLKQEFQQIVGPGGGFTSHESVLLERLRGDRLLEWQQVMKMFLNIYKIPDQYNCLFSDPLLKWEM
jgi:hypothetical protein